MKRLEGDIHPIGTLMYEDVTTPDTSNDWHPHRVIWRVIAHRECQDYPNAPIVMRDEIQFVRSENIKYCIKCGKPVEVCDVCDSGSGRRLLSEFSLPKICPKCKGIGTVHKCKPEDLEVKSFEERWREDEERRK